MEHPPSGSPPGLHRFSFETKVPPLREGPKLLIDTRLRLAQNEPLEPVPHEGTLPKGPVMGTVPGFSRLLILAASAMGFSFVPAAPVAGTLQISYLVTSDDASRFTAVWLESEDGDLVKTFFVSNELAQGAFTVEGDICPDWGKKAHWEKASQSDVDAVSGPTPTAGSGSLSFDLKKLGISPGVYFFCMQIHIHENYNILYKGKIRLGEKPAEVQAEVFYSPARYASAQDLLRDVRARFTPESAPNQ